MNRMVRIGLALLVGFIAAFLIGQLVIGGPEPAVSGGQPVDNPFPAVDHDPAAAADLIESWTRWRTSTFVVDGTWTRTLDSGGPPLSGPVHMVQQPPRRLVERLGARVAMFDDRVASCEPTGDTSDPAGLCAAGSTGMTYQQRVEAELVLVSGYVSGDSRVYDVGRGLISGCYRAELTVVALGSPWGRWAEFCFDTNTGALVSSRVRRQSAVDVEIDKVTSTVVTDSDFPAG